MRSLVFPVASAILAAGLGTVAWAQDAREPQLPEFAVQKHKLDNGLEVLLLEDHTTPVVAVNVFYQVGSKDEKPGRTGFAHLFEHMMFQGSQHHDTEFFGPIEKLGARINGTTNEDRTNYFESLPSNGLELALWLESDRMGFLLPALTQAKLDNQRDVVKNERRQRVDNVPYGLAEEVILEALYPPDHPYHHSVIGSMADLSAASRQDVVDFFRTFYTPNNASLALVGDFEPKAALALVEKYFGSLPRGPEPERPKPSTPRLAEPKHITMTDAVTLARTQLVWPSVPMRHDDDPALEILADVLSGLEKESRLYRALMYDRQIAADVRAGQQGLQLAGTFEIQATARPGQSLDDLVRRIDDEIERIKTDGPTDSELNKARTQYETRLISGLQSALRRADFLNHYNSFYGDPLAYKEEMRALFRVTPADVKRVANQYLSKNRIRLDVMPGPQAKRPPEVAVERKNQTEVAKEPTSIQDSFDRSKMPVPGPNPTFAPPPVVRRKLSNGLEVLISERHNLPLVGFRFVFKAGQNLDPSGREGLSEMTMNLLAEGTTTLNALELSGALSDIGATLRSESQRESSVVALGTLTKYSDRALELLADVVLHPSFPTRELERLRKEKLASIARRSDNAQFIARLVFPKTLYGASHPYGRIDTASSIENISRDDIVNLSKQILIPNRAALIVVGDTTPDAIAGKLEAVLKDWKPSDAAPLPPTPRPEPRPTSLYLVDKPGAAQTVLYTGLVGPLRNTQDYFAIQVMNAILGGQFSSRINLNLREDKGYTYGAQSMFVFRRGPGPFLAAASVQTAVTKEALNELVKELKEITGPRPPTASEIAFAKDNMIKGFPAEFETTGELASSLEELVLFDLPDDYFTRYQSSIEAVTSADVARVARQYIDPDHLLILVVGDRSQIEPGLKDLPYAQPIQRLDFEGNPLPNDPTAR